jgi:hypothetical protein
MVKKPQPKREATQDQAREELARKLLDVVNGLRASGKFPRMQEFVSSARAQGVRLGWDAIYAVSTLQGTGTPLVIQPFITRFLNGYVRGKEFKSQKQNPPSLNGIGGFRKGEVLFTLED